MNKLAAIEFVRFIKSQGINLKGARVLDIGCGELGEVAQALRRQGATVCG